MPKKFNASQFKSKMKREINKVFNQYERDVKKAINKYNQAVRQHNSKVT